MTSSPIEENSKCYPIHPYPHRPHTHPHPPHKKETWVLRVCSTSLLKTLWKKEKLFFTSNFSFSQSVFYPFAEVSATVIKFKIVVCKLVQFGRVQNLSFWKGLTCFFFQLFCLPATKTWTEA